MSQATCIMRRMLPPPNRSQLGIPSFLLAWAIGGTMAIAQSSAPIAAVPTSRAGSGRPPKWRSLGPDGGSISSIIVDPHHPSTVYAATQDNGVFKTTDGGASWRPVNVGLPGRRFVVVMVMDPHEESSLYVALDCCG